MTSEEKERRMDLALSPQDWGDLYREFFGEDPEFSGYRGHYPVEQLVDALIDERPIKEKTVPLKELA
ncbi:MAG: hypothetical protein VW683_04120 [Betaproteobacteria bacterium]